MAERNFFPTFIASLNVRLGKKHPVQHLCRVDSQGGTIDCIQKNFFKSKAKEGPLVELEKIFPVESQGEPLIAFEKNVQS